MQKSFVVNKMVKDILTNNVELQFTLQLNAEPKTITQKFNDISTANAYLYSNMRDWLLGVLDDYVNHKKHIIESGKHPNQVRALNICETALKAFHNGYKSLETIADQFLKGFEWFETILPSQQNPSYQGSIDLLTTIKKFCLTVQSKQLPQ